MAAATDVVAGDGGVAAVRHLLLRAGAEAGARGIGGQRAECGDVHELSGGVGKRDAGGGAGAKRRGERAECDLEEFESAAAGSVNRRERRE